MLGFQPFGDFDTKRIAHHVGVGGPQPRVSGIDEVQISADSGTCGLLREQNLIADRHNSTLSNR
ncbi:hypothetical protein A5772_02290 [Mycolicibacter sinensis]|nr:hypothetical protein A5772_02290 [Mycolicibacter sinensis]